MEHLERAPMTSDSDILKFAESIVDLHGNDAASHARMQIAELSNDGDLQSRVVWNLALKAIERTLQR
jgi:hypothetical protein